MSEGQAACTLTQKGHTPSWNAQYRPQGAFDFSTIRCYTSRAMSHPPEILEGRLFKPGCPTSLSHVLCRLGEDNRKEHEYRSWQGTLEAIWKPWDLWYMTLKYGANILELSDGGNGLVFASARVGSVCRTGMDLESIANVRELAEQLAPGIV